MKEKEEGKMSGERLMNLQMEIGEESNAFLVSLFLADTLLKHLVGIVL